MVWYGIVLYGLATLNMGISDNWGPILAPYERSYDVVSILGAREFLETPTLWMVEPYSEGVCKGRIWARLESLHGIHVHWAYQKAVSIFCGILFCGCRCNKSPTIRVHIGAADFGKLPSGSYTQLSLSLVTLVWSGISSRIPT